MRTVTLSTLLAAAAALASANAQEAPACAPAAADPVVAGSGPATPEWDSWLNKDLDVTIGNSIRAGVLALQRNKLTTAEEIFADVLRYKQYNADANFYMGVAKMNLGEWEDAKKHLQIALQKKPRHPDPKSRLGVTYAKLGETAGANALRADLVKMRDACKDTCRLSPYIMVGIQMIDEALAEPPAPIPAS